MVASAQVLYYVRSQATNTGYARLLGFDQVSQDHIRVINFSTQLSVVRSLLIDDILKFLAPIDDNLGSQIPDL